jgi:tRNA pseudouridine38-40 synthase
MGKYFYKLLVEYDGTDFCGWQIQPGKRTVQQTLREKIEVFTREQINLQGSGRTDTGVHAQGQVASFGLTGFIEPQELYYRLNRMLPDDIAIKRVTMTDEAFDPRRNATSRLYRYYIAETPQALSRRQSYQFHRRLNIGALNKAATIIKGRHDFSSFCRLKSLKDDNHCRVMKSRWFRYAGMLVYEVEADRFLHHMVRRLVGAMLAVEESRISLTQLKDYLNIKANVKYSVPALGLILIKVNYRRE